MSLTSFLTMLFEHGRIRVPGYAPVEERDLAEARAILSEFEPGYRLNLPGHPPEFLVETACWSAALLFRACQCLTYRDLDVQQTLPAIEAPAPGLPEAAHHYSADVVLRFLPDLWRLSRDVAVGDPLVKYLTDLAAVWPLSSVGMPDIAVRDMDEIANDRCLLILYADRILERQDHGRLIDPRVRSTVQSSIGLYTDLAPEMAQAVERAEKVNTKVGQKNC